jgi:hypothetical protein
MLRPTEYPLTLLIELLFLLFIISACKSNHDRVAKNTLFTLLPSAVTGVKDLFLAGNFYGVKPQMGRLDASYGTTLLGNATNGFTYIKPAESGLFINGEARDVTTVASANGGNYIVVAINNNSLSLFKNKSR